MDYLVRATAAGGQIRAFAVNTRDLVEEARQIHHTTPVASAALGRLMSAALMMGAMMKSERDLLTLSIRGDGPIGGLTVTADAAGNVKGFAFRPEIPVLVNAMHKLDVGGAIGKGTLTVIKDLGLKEPYSGQVDLVSGEIGDDLAYYFMTSEQTPSSVGVGVLVDTDDSILQAGGFIIQLMPDAEEETVAALEANLRGVRSVTALLSDGRTPEEILNELLAGLSPEIGEAMPLRFYCNCDRARVQKALISLGKKELDEMAAEGKDVTLHCDFCGKDYSFGADEIATLAK